jgi:hypothetical protein
VLRLERGGSFLIARVTASSDASQSRSVAAEVAVAGAVQRLMHVGEPVHEELEGYPSAGRQPWSRRRGPGPAATRLSVMQSSPGLPRDFDRMTSEGFREVVQRIRAARSSSS